MEPSISPYAVSNRLAEDDIAEQPLLLERGFSL